MQTFVLAPQSAKAFYIYNDIFRYQDEVFGDPESSDSEREIFFFFFSSLKSSEVIYSQSFPAGFAVSFLKEITSVWMTVLPVFVQKAQCWNCETMKFQ